jgi:hypothetical protein
VSWWVVVGDTTNALLVGLVRFSWVAFKPEYSDRAGTSFEAFEPEMTNRVAPEVAGDFDAPEVAGDFDAPEVAGDFDAPEVAGDFDDLTDVVGSAPEVAGDFFDPSLKVTTLLFGASSLLSARSSSCETVLSCSVSSSLLSAVSYGSGSSQSLSKGVDSTIGFPSSSSRSYCLT